MNDAPQIEMRPAAELVPYARNARTHSREQVEQLKESFRRFGVNTPVGVDEQGIMVGHGRVLAMVGMWEAGETVMGPGKRSPLPKGMVPTLDLSGLNEDERRAYILADNALAEQAGWAWDVLRNEMRAIREGDESLLGVVGFPSDTLADLLAERTEGKTDPDVAPPCPAKPVTVPGDLWLLGKHRLLCGDSTVATDVERALNGLKPNLMATDPPYGVNYDPAWRNETGKDRQGVTRHKSSRHQLVSETATRATGKVSNDDRADWREAYALFPGNVAYVWHGGLHVAEVAASLEAVRLKPRAHIIWVKPRMAIGRGAYHWQHEPAFFAVKEGAEGDGWQGEVGERFEEDAHLSLLYAVKKGETAHWRGGRKQTTVWTIEHLRSETGHGTQKPVECMARPMRNNSAPGEAVYDPFLGSGTTIIAGEMLDRRVIGVEIDPAYVDVAVLRWQAFTGLKATLAPREDGVDAFAGRSFAEVAEGREVQLEAA